MSNDRFIFDRASVRPSLGYTANRISRLVIFEWHPNQILPATILSDGGGVHYKSCPRKSCHNKQRNIRTRRSRNRCPNGSTLTDEDRLSNWPARSDPSTRKTRYVPKYMRRKSAKTPKIHVLGGFSGVARSQNSETTAGIFQVSRRSSLGQQPGQLTPSSPLLETDGAVSSGRSECEDGFGGRVVEPIEGPGGQRY
jgi:hypothetical protein